MDVKIISNTETTINDRLYLFGKNSLSCHVRMFYTRLCNIYRVYIQVERSHNNPVDTCNTPFCWWPYTGHWTHKLLAPNTDFCTPYRYRIFCSPRNRRPYRRNISCIRCSAHPGTHPDTRKLPCGRWRDTGNSFRMERRTRRRDFCISRSDMTDRRHNPCSNDTQPRTLRSNICDYLDIACRNYTWFCTYHCGILLHTNTPCWPYIVLHRIQFLDRKGTSRRISKSTWYIRSTDFHWIRPCNYTELHDLWPCTQHMGHKWWLRHRVLERFKYFFYLVIITKTFELYTILSHFTSTLFVDTRFVVGTRSIATTPSDAQTILANLIWTTFRVWIAHRLANSTVTPFVRQTLQVPK